MGYLIAFGAFVLFFVLLILIPRGPVNPPRGERPAPPLVPPTPRHRYLGFGMYRIDRSAADLRDLERMREEILGEGRNPFL